MPVTFLIPSVVSYGDLKGKVLAYKGLILCLFQRIEWVERKGTGGRLVQSRRGDLRGSASGKLA
jgi:hypothetical protein